MNHPAWLERLLGEPNVTDILINGSRSVFCESPNGMREIEIAPHERFSAPALHQWVLGQLSQAGKSWDARLPFADVKMKEGHRLHVAFPPVHDEVLASIRAAPRSDAHGDLCFGQPENLELLRKAVRDHDTVLIAGATGSGKTTLLNALLGEVPESERIIALEEVAELFPRHPHFIRLTARAANADGFGEVNLRTLLKQALRMRPDRLLLGECRGAEVLDLLQALNTGHRGTLATVHANSARDALRRLELLALMFGPSNLSSRVVRELIASSVRFVAHVRKAGDRRIISEIIRIEGLEGDVIRARPMVQTENRHEH